MTFPQKGHLHLLGMLAMIDPTTAYMVDTTAQLVALRAEVERLRADAERYRWLRDAHTHHVFVTRMVGGAVIPRFFDAELDALIDAARATAAPGEGRE